jgi:phage baseplate assembly protein W
MAKKQYFGIKYPFTNISVEKYELDLNNSEHEAITSELLHLIFTPKGQRLRKPNFGTNLIKFIFETNNSDTWIGVKQEIQNSVSEWLPNVALNDVNVMVDESGTEINVRLDYSIKEGSDAYDYSIVVQI